MKLKLPTYNDIERAILDRRHDRYSEYLTVGSADSRYTNETFWSDATYVSKTIDYLVFMGSDGGMIESGDAWFGIDDVDWEENLQNAWRLEFGFVPQVDPHKEA